MPKEKSSYRRHIRINGRLISKRFLRKADADLWYQDQLRKKQRTEAGIEEHVFRTTLKEFAERWLVSRKTNGQPVSSYLQDEARLRLYIYPHFGHRVLETISTKEWDQFLSELIAQKDLAAGTRNRVRSLMSKMYNDAIRLEAASRNPISIIPKAKEKMKTWDYWQTKEECSKYLAAAEAESSSFGIFAHLALNTGARIGEILALENQDVDLTQRRIRIWRIFEAVTQQVQQRTKSFTERWLGINDALLDALKKHRQASGDPNPRNPLVVNAQGLRIDSYAVRRIHKRVCKKAGVREIRIHDLRHTFASHYVMNGGSLAELQGLLGHSSPQMTLKYAHLAPGFLESRASVVSFSSAQDPTSSLKLIVSK